ncbi:CRTAC1 family protein [Tautonia rosea]|uniref:CRTAC1 family protein n=1 Tax=Tautonia rosea TaxID=2728037 RepID=UPI0014746483|nr:CRTAC1 family protein [Tautonia rosea]
MIDRSRSWHGHAHQLFAITVILSLFVVARLPVLSSSDRDRIAEPFEFTRQSFAELSGFRQKFVRKVHPSLRGHASWTSSVGAAVALNDLDGDGYPNDFAIVDPRIDQVIVGPVPGTDLRFDPFVLDPAPLSYDSERMAPMGCLPGDLNEDGRMDLLVYYWGRPPIAFLCLDETPGGLNGDCYARCEVSPDGGRWYTNAATMADVDGDGHADLIVGNYHPDDALILDAQGTGHEVMQDSMSRAQNGGRNRVLLWSGSGPGPMVRFREDREALADGRPNSWTLAVAAADLDGDLLPELFFANDFGPDQLLHNRSTPGRTRLVAVEGLKLLTTPNSKVLGNDSFKGMGADFGDLNGDGLLDLYVSNIAASYALEESHHAWISTGAVEQFRSGVAPYTDQSEALGIARSGWGWDTKMADFDNDGVLEIVQAVGFVRGQFNRWPELHELAMGNDELLRDPTNWPQFVPGDDLSGDDRNPFFVRSSSGRYYDLAPDLGFTEEPGVSRGLATADVDGDGRLDFAVANQWASSSFYRNTGDDAGAFLGLHLLRPLRPGAPGETRSRPGHPGRDTPGSPAIGATVIVSRLDGKRLAGQVDGGNGHSGKRSHALHFGLGRDPEARTEPVAVNVRWRHPDGTVDESNLVVPPGWHTVLLGWPEPSLTRTGD